MGVMSTSVHFARLCLASLCRGDIRVGSACGHRL